MLVIGRVTRDASCRQLDLVRHGRAVAILATHLAMLPGQRVVSLRVVIEFPSRPLDRVVTRRAVGTVTAFVNVLLLVARTADGIGVEEGRGRVALYAGEPVMFPQEREISQVVIETNIGFPVRFCVALPAAIA